MKNLPNLLTLLNATFGVAAIYFIQMDSSTGVVLCLVVAAIFDVFDGMLARKLGSSGELGKELDSLADAISFGAVPAFLWSSILSGFGNIAQPYAIFMGGLIASSSIYRLAKFNLSTDQGKDFIGMPTPANALFTLGIWSWLGSWDSWQWYGTFTGDQKLIFTMVLIVLWALSLYWTNAGFRIMSLKDTKEPKRKKAQILLIVLFVVFSYFFRALALTIVVFLLPLITKFIPTGDKELK